MIEYLNVEVVLLLVLAHLAGDFVLQSDASVEAKRAGQPAAHIRHACWHAVLAYLCLGLWTLGLLPLIIGLTHGVIDAVKEAVVRSIERRRDDLPRPGRVAIFLIDQLLHLAVIVIVVGLAEVLAGPLSIPAWIAWFGPEAMNVCILLIGLVVTIWVGAVAIGFGTEPYLDHLTAAAERDREEGASPAAIRRGFPKGGRIIGLLERALVFLFVITGNMTGVGFLVAAKSVFRFGEIREPTQRKEAEYIIIGTLMSFTWAIFAATLTRLAMGANLLG